MEASSPLGNVEVERKFVFDENTISRIKDIGGTLLKEATFTDTYYDNNAYTLTKKECWLRKRNEIWQLKYTDDKKDRTMDLDTVHKETINEQEILNILCDVLTCRAPQGQHIEGFIGDNNLHPFAEIVTLRKTFELQGGVHIDLDETDFGLRIGEIEMMMEGLNQVPDALDKIEETASKLGNVLFYYFYSCLTLLFRYLASLVTQSALHCGKGC